MKRATTLALIVLGISLAAAAVASTLDWDVSTFGGSTTYTYILTSDENDVITALHVYAPAPDTVITDWSADPGWKFMTEADQDTGGSDIYWYSDPTQTSGVQNGGWLQVSFTTPESVATNYNFVVPGYLGNWGYETEQWAGWGAFIMLDSVPVPQGSSTATPEPMSLFALGSGLAAFGLTKLRRRS